MRQWWLAVAVAGCTGRLDLDADPADDSDADAHPVDTDPATETDAIDSPDDSGAGDTGALTCGDFGGFHAPDLAAFRCGGSACNAVLARGTCVRRDGAVLVFATSHSPAGGGSSDTWYFDLDGEPVSSMGCGDLGCGWWPCDLSDCVVTCWEPDPCQGPPSDTAEDCGLEALVADGALGTCG